MTPQKIIRNYLIIAGLYTLSASLIWGVNTLFLLDAGLDIAGVFIANAAFSAGMFFFEIPTGVLADTSGRRVSFLWSTAVLALGTLGYVGIAAIGGNLTLFVLMSVILGLGFTFYSGAVEAWLVDALNATGYEDNLDQVFARGAFITGGAMLVGTISGGFLGNVDLALPFIGRAVLLIAAFIIAYVVMHDIGYTPHKFTLAAMPAEMKKLTRDSLTFGWNERPIRLLMLVSIIQYGVIAWTFYAWPPYLLELLGQDAVWVAGVVSALIALSTMAGNTLVEWFSRYCGKRTTLLLWAAAVQTAAIVGLGFAGSFWIGVFLVLVMMATTGVAGPVQQAYIHNIIPSEQRATIVSFNSMLSSGGSVLGQTGLGQLAQARSIATGYVAGGAATLLALPLLIALRRLNDDGDLIVGRAGQQAACAGQGLPEVTAVAANPISQSE
jgi:MFS family permease